MSVVDLTEEIQKGIQQVAQRDLIVRRVTELTRLDSRLNQIVPLVAESVSLIQAGEAAGVPIDATGIVELRQRVDDLLQVSGDDSMAITELESVISDLNAEVTSIKNAIALGWHEVVDSKVPQLDGMKELAHTFERLTPGDARADGLEHAVSVAEQLRRTPPSSEALRRLEEVATEIPRLLRDLVGDEPSVRAFAEGVGRGGAALASVTPEVENWITSKGFGRAFKIVPGEPGVYEG